MGYLLSKIDTSEGTDAGQAKLILWVDQTYRPPVFVQCRGLGVEHYFNVTLNAAGVAKYEEHAATLSGQLTNIFAEFWPQIFEGGTCGDRTMCFGWRRFASRVTTAPLPYVYTSVNLEFGETPPEEPGKPSDCIVAEDYYGSSLVVQIQAPGARGYFVKDFVASLGPADSAQYPSDATRLADLKAAVAAHPNGLAKQTGPMNWTLQLPGGPFGSYGSIQLTIVSGSVMRVNVSPSFTVGQAWEYNSVPPLGSEAELSITKIGAEPSPYNFWPGSAVIPWVQLPLRTDYANMTIRRVEQTDEFFLYEISGGPNFGVFSSAGRGTMWLYPRVLVMRDSGIPPERCLIHWTYRNLHPLNDCETEWQLHTDQNHRDSPGKKAPCRFTTVAVPFEEESEGPEDD